MLHSKVKNYKKKHNKTVYQKPNDKFWKDSFMRVLHAMYWEEGTWATDKWKEFGISASDRRKIENEFESFQKKMEKLESGNK